MRFSRAMQNKKRSPPDIMKVYAMGGTTRNDLFKKWQAADEDLETLLTITQSSIKTTVASNLMGWRTRAWLMAEYNQDANFVDNIVKEKTRMRRFKPHPDFPHDGNHTLYLVVLKLDELQEDRVTHETSTTTSGAITADVAESLSGPGGLFEAGALSASSGSAPTDPALKPKPPAKQKTKCINIDGAATPVLPDDAAQTLQQWMAELLQDIGQGTMMKNKLTGIAAAESVLKALSSSVAYLC